MHLPFVSPQRVIRVQEAATCSWGWSERHSKRQERLKAFWAFLDSKRHKILQASQTGLLLLHSVVHRVLEQYEALKCFIKEEVMTPRLLAPQTILQWLEDPLVRMYLKFFEFVPPMFTNLNKQMQSEFPQIHHLRKAVGDALKTIYDRYINSSYLRATPIEQVEFENPAKFLKLEEVYLGAKVQCSLVKEHSLPAQHVKGFHLRCVDFYIESVQQINSRFSFKDEALRLLEVLNPSNLMDLAPFVPCLPNIVGSKNQQALDSEWRQFRNIDHEAPEAVDHKKFWKTSLKTKHGDDSLAFLHFIKVHFLLALSATLKCRSWKDIFNCLCVQNEAVKQVECVHTCRHPSHKVDDAGVGLFFFWSRKRDVNKGA